MTYPPAPWRLEGYGIQTLHWVDVTQAAAFVPSELEIVSFLPGKTLAGIYVSAYEADSLLQYNELIVVPAVVRYQKHMGAWISHIYVDNEDSVAGGREIWGLPKEMAEFSWHHHSQVSIRQNQRELCHINYQTGMWSLSTWWKQELSGEVFGRLGSELLCFQGQLQSQIGLLTANLEIPPASPFATLNLGQPWLTLNLPNLELVAGVPQSLGNR